MSRLTAWMDRRFYPGHAKNWDDLLFRERISARLTPNMTILDLGAGAGIVQAMNFKGLSARVCGIDLDPRVATNPMLDEGLVTDGVNIPYPDASFDLVFADNVFEHLADPAGIMREIGRVLRPGGHLLFKTPNRTHYMPLIASVTPHWFHQLVNRIRGRAEADTFPTLYRANSPARVRALARETGFTDVSVALVEGRPEYLRMSAPTYFAGLLYERIVNRFEALSGLRILLVAEMRKPETGG